MNIVDRSPPAKRAYRLGARAEAANAAAERMTVAFLVRLRDDWFEEIRLEDVARDADVSVQTLIRRFGGKDGLLQSAIEHFGLQVMARRTGVAGDTDRVIRAVIDDYEIIGDFVMRILAQEDRHPAIRRATDVGRAGHRAWVAEAFAPILSTRPAGSGERCLDALVVATDLYLWKLIRRDMGRSVEELHALMRRFIDAALAEPDSPTAKTGRPS